MEYITTQLQLRKQTGVNLILVDFCMENLNITSLSQRIKNILAQIITKRRVQNKSYTDTICSSFKQNRTLKC